uniref:Uncharacterized protein n=1 Tax=Rhizophora mucronata TaxID=61149 RepID=A0A2P2PKW3_RHIMU
MVLEFESLSGKWSAFDFDSQSNVYLLKDSIDG